MNISPLAMTAKKVIEAAWLNGPTYDMATEAAEALESAQLLQDPETIAALRTEAGAAAEAYDGELAMFRFLIRVLRIAARNGDLAEVQRLLWEHATDESTAYAAVREKSSRPTADATPHQPRTRDRQQILLGRIRREGGEWTTRRAQRTYRALGITGVFRSAVRADLAALHQGGHLVLHAEDPARRFYTFHSKGGGDQ
ncbi:hypothetical protein [Streptomyces rochei]|uniref:hypothetical protein n=1 Tax=Streptomyces rochei TaxID=1928 RepID=UPI003700FB03